MPADIPGQILLDLPPGSAEAIRQAEEIAALGYTTVIVLTPTPVRPGRACACRGSRVVMPGSPAAWTRGRKVGEVDSFDHFAPTWQEAVAEAHRDVMTREMEVPHVR